MTKLTFIGVSFFSWLIVVAVLSVLPIPDEIYLPINSGKISHFLIYFITAFLFYRSFKYTFRFALFLSFLFPSIFGVLMEVIQHFILTRGFSLANIAADVGGTGIFVLFSTFFRNEVKKEFLTEDTEKNEQN